ncbi:DUF4328 domain-containing protein [Kitasatospora sp. NPDC058965]|uniref:DUF4328 domain-containing protein n=1 Tax=Kitasatospora sp. NPDC058965 TaxID=3346682 RepID=UPI0036919A8D
MSNGDPARPNPRAIAYHGPLADPRPFALATQVMIAVGPLAYLAVMATGGRDSAVVWLVPVSSALFVIRVGLFLTWFHRCRRNAEHFGPGRHAFSEADAVGLWFHPRKMFWAPRRAALDIWRACGGTGSPWLINAWWAAWLAKLASAFVFFCISGTVFDPDATYVAQIGVVAAGLAILVIHQLTEAQDVMVGLKDRPAGR